MIPAATMPAMKRIKQIIEALKVLNKTPSKVIRKAIGSVLIDATNRAIEEQAGATDEERQLIENILNAVLVLAEDMEKPVKAESEVAK